MSAGLREAAAAAANDTDAAIRIVREVLEFAPTEPRAWQMLGELLGQAGATDEAEQSLERALQLRNNSGNKPKMPISKRLAEMLWQNGDREAARAMLAILLLRKPHDDTLLALKDTWEGENAK